MVNSTCELRENKMLDASIIICTRNRAPALEKTLLSLSLMQTASSIKYEIIIVDNGSTDSTNSVVSAWFGRLPLRYLYEARPGLSHARNYGLSASFGNHIFFTDDDCIISPSWLSTGSRLLSELPRQIIGGRVELHESTDRPITIKLGNSPASLSSTSDLLGFLHGCNMIFGRCVIDEVGMFDTLLGAGTPCKGAEDADFVYRAFRRDIPVQYRPELHLAHNHGRKHVSDEKTLTDGYILSLGAITAKYMLRGDISLLRVAYWQLRSEKVGQRRRRMKNYVFGAVNYGKLVLKKFFISSNQVWVQSPVCTLPRVSIELDDTSVVAAKISAGETGAIGRVGLNGSIRPR